MLKGANAIMGVKVSESLPLKTGVAEIKELVNKAFSESNSEENLIVIKNEIIKHVNVISELRAIELRDKRVDAGLNMNEFATLLEKSLNGNFY